MSETGERARNQARTCHSERSEEAAGVGTGSGRHDHVCLVHGKPTAYATALILRFAQNDKRIAAPFSPTFSSCESYVVRFTFYASRLAWAREHALALVSTGLVGLLYLLALLSMPPDALTHHDAGAKYLQVRNLRLSPSGLDWSINYPARQLDPELEFVPFHPKQHRVDGNHRIHLQWPIFLGLLTRIPWKVMGFWGLYVVPFLSGFGVLWAAYLLALRLGMPRRVAWLAIPLLGLATPIPIYSLLFFEHTLAALLVTLSLLAAVVSMGESGPSLRAVALSGALMALAVYFRSELYILAIIMAAWYAFLAWRQRAHRAAATWVAAFLAGLAPLWAFYAVTTGTVLPLHATWYFAGAEGSGDSGASGLPALRYIASVGWGVVPDFLFGPRQFPLSPLYPVWVEVLGLVGVGLCALAAVVRLLRGRSGLPIGLLLAGLSCLVVSTAWVLLSTQHYYNLHGFLLASPFVALALWPSGSSTEPTGVKPEGWLAAVALLYVGLHALIISAFSGLGSASTHEWGQRYLLPAYPVLVVLSLLSAWRIWSGEGVRVSRFPFPASWLLPVWALLIFIGIGFSVRGYAVLHEQRAQVAAWMQLARTLPERRPVVTDVWWLPLNLAGDFYTRPIMLAEGDEHLARLVRQLQNKDVKNFGFMSTDPMVFDGRWNIGIVGIQRDGPPQEMRGMWLQRYIFTSIRQHATENGTLSLEPPPPPSIGILKYYSLTSYWHGRVGDLPMSVYAGNRNKFEPGPNDYPRHGAVIILAAEGEGNEFVPRGSIYITRTEVGTLRIINEEGGQLTLQAEDGALLFFDLATRQWVE